jgi:PKD repeat protein
MFVLEIDDIKIEGCNAEDTDGGGDNGGGDNGDGTDDLTASFTANYATIAVGETVSFTNTSTGNIQAYQWNISGGDYEYVNGTSNSAEDIDVQFNEEGTFSVYLLTADGVNAPATSATATITVSGDGDGGGDNGGGDNGGEPNDNLPIAAFVADITLPGVSDVVTFTNNSLNTDGATYDWSFEGNPSESEATYVNGTSSTDAEPSLTFEPGVYNVTLIITTDEGADTLERTNYILAGDPIEGLWNSDFSDAADWTISEGWVIGTAAPAGQYSGGLGAIASSTADNGFALYDADVIGGASTGSITMANAISLSGVTNAAVVLEYYYRNFYDTLMVEYSTDNSAWNVLKMLNDGMAPNDLTANPSAITISAAELDGESQVWFRITYQGSYGGYAAMVDDFAVIEQPNNDLKGLSSTLDYVSTTYAGAVPLSQVEGIQLGASVLNNGVVTQTNMQLNAEIINGDGSVVFSSSSAAKEIATGVIDTVFVEDQFIPTATGNYEATYFFSQDELDASFTNNGANKLDFAVTDTVFARAMIPSTFFGANVAGGDTVQLGANYLIVEETEVSSASVQVAWYTGAGAVIRLNVYSWNTVDGSRTLVASSRDYTIGSIAEGELEKVTLSFDEKPTLSPGDYTASVEVVSYANDGDDFVVSCDNVSPIFTPLAATILARAGGGNHAWYTLSTTPHVYLNIVDPTPPVVVSVENEDLFNGEINVFPNPNNGQFTVTLTDVNDENAYIEFINPIGQLIERVELNAASETINMRSKGLAEGLYYIKLVSPTTHSVNVTKVIIQ